MPGCCGHDRLETTSQGRRDRSPAVHKVLGARTYAAPATEARKASSAEMTLAAYCAFLPTWSGCSGLVRLVVREQHGGSSG